MNDDTGSQAMRRARKWSAFLPQFFSNAYVSIVAILAGGLMFFLALMGLLNLEGNHPNTSFLSQVEVAAFLVVVILSVIVVVLLFINLMFAIAGNTAEQAERISITSARGKVRKSVLKAMEKAAETQTLPLPSSVVESFLPPPDVD
jgi:uncharacterized membrane protein